jgi:hypothetical protein
MDKWHSVGKFPVVIYGPKAELICVHSTDSLGLKEADDHIKQTISSYWWNKDSISVFGPNEEFFFIRLHWKKQLIIELSNGTLIDEAPGEWRMPALKWKAIQEDGKSKIRKRAISLLESKDPQKHTSFCRKRAGLAFLNLFNTA